MIVAQLNLADGAAGGHHLDVIVPSRRPHSLVRALCLVVSLVIAATGCGSSTSPSGSGAAPEATASQPGGALGSPGEPSGSPALGVPAGPLPEPTLTDPVEIGNALWDPGRVEVGVVSMLAAIGVAIDADNGSPLRAGTGPLARLHLTEAEVRGLIEMGTADAAADMQHQLKFTLGDLSSALAKLVPGMTEDAILAAYVTAYRAAPGDLVRESLAGHAFLKATPFTRVHLWLLLVDGVLGRGSDGTARGGADAEAL